MVLARFSVIPTLRHQSSLQQQPNDALMKPCESDDRSEAGYEAVKIPRLPTYSSTLFRRAIPLVLLFAVPGELRALDTIPESFVEQGHYYVGNVFGDHDYAAHTNVHLQSFFMMKKEITYSLYHQVYTWAKRNGYSFNPGCNGAYYEDCLPPDSDQGLHPVTNITWLDTLVFANALSEMLQLQPVYLVKEAEPLRTSDSKVTFYLNPQATGYRLPTLSEWQVAARGGKKALATGRYGYHHSGSQDAKKVAWYPAFESGHVGTRIVGQLAPNALGIFDMSGNVSEWVYQSDVLGHTTLYYFCGGSYLSHATSLASCDSHSSGFVMSDIGFRLIRNGLRDNE